ncbi:hypothetical protein FSST1_012715 [Fusarium sambucinum]
MVPWTPEEYMEIYWDTQRIYDENNPDSTILEPLYTHGLIFCYYRGVRWMVLSPNTTKEFTVPLQTNWLRCGNTQWPVQHYPIPYLGISYQQISLSVW